MSLPRAVTAAIKKVEAAKDLATYVIKQAIAEEARKRKLTKIELLVWESKYWRGDKVVANARIEELLEAYNEEIHSGGLMGIWSDERGWEA